MQQTCGTGGGVGVGVGVEVGVGVGRRLLEGYIVVVVSLVEVWVVVTPPVTVAVAVPVFKMLLQKSKASAV